MSQGGTLAFWAKTYVTLVTLDFASLFPCLFPIYRLLFFIMRRIHVNESTQIRPCPWMYACNQIHGLVGRRPLISVVEGNHRLDPRIIGGRADLFARCRPILSFFGPPNYPLSHGTISFSAKVSPLTTSSPYFFQSALRISSTPLLIFFPNNLLEIALTSVMVGGGGV